MLEITRITRITREIVSVFTNEHDRNDYYKRYNNDKKIQSYLIRSFGPLVFDILLKF